MSTWLGWPVFPRIPFPGRFWVEWATGESLVWNLEGRGEATAILLAHTCCQRCADNLVARGNGWAYNHSLLFQLLWLLGQTHMFSSKMKGMASFCGTSTALRSEQQEPRGLSIHPSLLFQTTCPTDFRSNIRQKDSSLRNYYTCSNCIRSTPLHDSAGLICGSKHCMIWHIFLSNLHHYFLVCSSC